MGTSLGTPPPERKMPNATSDAAQKAKKTLAEFLESTPPGVSEEISDLFTVESTPNVYWAVSQPEILLHCWSDACQGSRFFRCPSRPVIVEQPGPNSAFLKYFCRNCGKSEKTYALCLQQHNQEYPLSGTAIKYGELPSFGPHTPSRLISLIGPDRDFFLQGRRAENQGLGIGAFAYYRRVVENQKSRIITEIGKVAQKLGTPDEMLKKLEIAANEPQFSRAVDDVKGAIPDSLLIQGHNPLKLLHSALSDEIHNAQTDQDCLQIAQDIRVVLTELADRISQILKDESELRHSVGRLLKRGTGNTSN